MRCLLLGRKVDARLSFGLLPWPQRDGFTAGVGSASRCKQRQIGVPDTLPTCDLCLRRATLIPRAQYGPKLRKPAVLIAQTPTSASSTAGFLALSPSILRWVLFYPRRGRSGTLRCVRGKQDWLRWSELARYCTSLLGTAMLYRRRCGIIERRTGNRLKNLN
jgi:hypothetical protein